MAVKHETAEMSCIYWCLPPFCPAATIGKVIDLRFSKIHINPKNITIYEL